MRLCLISDPLLFEGPLFHKFRAGCQTRGAIVPGLGFEPLGTGELEVAIGLL